MLGGPLRYPLVDERGRRALLETTGGIVAIAVGTRYAAALVPSVVALVPALVALVGVFVVFGSSTQVLLVGLGPLRPSLRRLLRDGARAFLLALAVLGPALGLLVLTVAGMPEARTIEAGAGPFLLAATTASLLFFLAFAYVLPILVVASASAGRFRAAFDLETVGSVASDAGYFLGWAVGGSLVGIAMGLVTVTLQSDDPVGLFAAVLAGYLVVAGSRAVGDGFASARGREETRSA